MYVEKGEVQDEVNSVSGLFFYSIYSVRGHDFIANQANREASVYGPSPRISIYCSPLPLSLSHPAAAKTGAHDRLVGAP